MHTTTVVCQYRLAFPLPTLELASLVSLVLPRSGLDRTSCQAFGMITPRPLVDKTDFRQVFFNLRKGALAWSCQCHACQEQIGQETPGPATYAQAA